MRSLNIEILLHEQLVQQPSQLQVERAAVGSGAVRG